MATSYLSPGVYIEEVDRGSKPIEAVGTSTCAFHRRIVPSAQHQRSSAGHQLGAVHPDLRRLSSIRLSSRTPSTASSTTRHEGVRLQLSRPRPSALSRRRRTPRKRSRREEGHRDGKPAIRQPPPAQAAALGASPALFIGKDEGPGRRSGLNVSNDIPEISLVWAPGQADAAIQTRSSRTFFVFPPGFSYLFFFFSFFSLFLFLLHFFFVPSSQIFRERTFFLFFFLEVLPVMRQGDAARNSLRRSLFDERRLNDEPAPPAAAYGQSATAPLVPVRHLRRRPRRRFAPPTYAFIGSLESARFRAALRRVVFDFSDFAHCHHGLHVSSLRR